MNIQQDDPLCHLLQALTTPAAALVIGGGNNISMKLHLNYRRLHGGVAFRGGRTCHRGSGAQFALTAMSTKWPRQT